MLQFRDQGYFQYGRAQGPRKILKWEANIHIFVLTNRKNNRLQKLIIQDMSTPLYIDHKAWFHIS